MTVAALYVEVGGVYYGLEDVVVYPHAIQGPGRCAAVSRAAQGSGEGARAEVEGAEPWSECSECCGMARCRSRSGKGERAPLSRNAQGGGCGAKQGVQAQAQGEIARQTAGRELSNATQEIWLDSEVLRRVASEAGRRLCDLWWFSAASEACAQAVRGSLSRNRSCARTSLPPLQRHAGDGR